MTIRDGFEGLRVVAFESRRADALQTLIARHGGDPVSAPTMQEVPLEAGPPIVAFADGLRHGELDVLLLLTGVGTRALAEVLEVPGAGFPGPIMTRAEFADQLRKLTIGARGPKTVAALRELGVDNYLSAPEPHTWRELFETIKAHRALTDTTVAIQQYGVPHPELEAALQAEGAEVVQVPVYRWRLPEDTQGIELAISDLCANRIQVALFTSAPQVDHLLKVAERTDQASAVLAALRRCVVGSIGPSCSERLRGHGIAPDVEPDHSKMGQLVGAVAKQAHEMHRRKESAP